MMFPPDIERSGKLLLLAVVLIFIASHAWQIVKAIYRAAF
jgi:hypothetical protein